MIIPSLKALSGKIIYQKVDVVIEHINVKFNLLGNNIELVRSHPKIRNIVANLMNLDITTHTRFSNTRSLSENNFVSLYFAIKLKSTEVHPIDCVDPKTVYFLRFNVRYLNQLT